MRSRSYLAGCLFAFAGFALALGSAGAARAAEECLECHSTADNVGEESLVVDETKRTAPVHGAAGWGGRHRSSPTGGAANGMPLNDSTPSAVTPCN